MAGRTVFVTGGDGFIGSAAVPLLAQQARVLAPTRDELDLLDAAAVERYVRLHEPDVIVHLANPNPAKDDRDQAVEMHKGSMDAFMACYRCRNLVERMVYMGSGAEYDKRFDICTITEEEFGRSYPADPYGAAKYVQNELARAAGNVVNLRLFACFGPHDHWTKFITHCVRSVLAGLDITIRQDCYFDYLHVSDLARIICWAALGEPAHADYNVASGRRVLLSQIAALVVGEMQAENPVILLSDGLNREYTASIGRLRVEYQEPFMSLEDGVRAQIAYEESVWPPEGYAQI